MKVAVFTFKTYLYFELKFLRFLYMYMYIQTITKRGNMQIYKKKEDLNKKCRKIQRRFLIKIQKYKNLFCINYIYCSSRLLRQFLKHRTDFG